MTRDDGRRQRRSGDAGACPSRAARRPFAPAVDHLEGRLLLSFYNGPTTSRPVIVGHAFYQATVTGGGYETVHVTKQGHASITLIGTGPNSVFSLGSQTGKIHFSSTAPLQVDQITVKSGSIQSIQAAGADLVGTMSLPGGATSIQLGSIGPNARLDVGSVGALTVGTVQLGPTGEVHIAGSLGGPSSIGSLSIDGGQFLVDGAITGMLTVGSVTLQRGGRIAVTNDLTGGLTVSGDFQAMTDGTLLVGHDVTGPAAAQATSSTTTPTGALIVDGRLVLNGGRIIVGGDMTGGLSAGSLALSNNGAISVGRDFSGGLNVSGDLSLDSEGKIAVGRDLGSLTVGGDLTFTPTAGAIGVSGNLVDGATIQGVFQGHGNGDTDLAVGLNLNNLTVNGGQANSGGLQGASIFVGKDLLGLNILHGIFNSIIKVGNLIDGESNGTQPSGGNVGADGPDAVFDSEIRAGVRIQNLLINGNVRSDYVTNPHPTGYRTRIIAGEDPQGNFTAGGSIDNFQITGALIDSVVAASVQPFGGDGTLPPSGYTTQTISNTPGDGGFDTYDAPAGTITGGTVTAPVSYANYSEVNVVNQTVTGVAYNTTIDPTIDDLILPGSINASFATTPLSADQLANPVVTTSTSTGSTSSGSSTQSNSSSTTTDQTTTLSLPLPTKSTVLGGVISTSHGSNPDAYDFAGIFAADTRGVFVGALPQ